MQNVLIVIHLMIVLALVGVVLIQRSEGGGLGIGGGSGFMSARGTANALTRTTAILAALFFATSLGLGLLTRYESRPTDILDRIPAQQGQGNGILDTLGPSSTTPSQAPGTNGVPSTTNGASNQAPAQQPAPATTTTPAAPAEGGAAAPAAPAPQQAPANTNGVPTGQ
ncbi:preprotein translocase subunit SecG [Agrobacterium cavarae]|uniref:preprotein translocase subunit SecG n=1 Tax=Agrobacterium cavarae TaxID=2528239 RepID=UPI0028A831B7|nr:preprotein translocase subunit SecG [Agrobacterium cavarae]